MGYARVKSCEPDVHSNDEYGDSRAGGSDMRAPTGRDHARDDIAAAARASAAAARRSDAAARSSDAAALASALSARALSFLTAAAISVDSGGGGVDSEGVGVAEPPLKTKDDSATSVRANTKKRAALSTAMRVNKVREKKWVGAASPSASAAIVGARDARAPRILKRVIELAFRATGPCTAIHV